MKDTLTEVRAKYWIVKGRSLVKSVVQNVYSVRSLKVDLIDYWHHLKYRVNEAPPFLSTGVDFAGLLYVKTQGLA